MEHENILLVVAVFAVAVSLFVAYSSFGNLLTGHLVATGTVNLSVTTNSQINFTVANVNFGAGTVEQGGFVNLITNGTTSGGASWGTVSTPLTVENIGNVNVTLNISFGKNADSLIGGTSPLYKYNVSNSEANSCNVGTSGFGLGVFRDANSTSTRVCDIFAYDNNLDVITIDLWIAIPDDPLHTGARGDVITLTY